MESNEKSDRLVEAACAVLGAAPGRRLNVVVLNKVLFYLDLASLRDQGTTITHNSYIALQQGPVVAKYTQRLVAQLETRGHGKQISEWDGSKPILLERNPEHNRFLDNDSMAIVCAVTSYFAEMTSQQASLYSHDNPGWQLAWDDYRRTGKPHPINLHLAIQQIVEDDPWMEAPLLDDDEILAAADAGDGVEW
jgi:hypothetical protein